jgi:hypothetical protein
VPKEQQPAADQQRQRKQFASFYRGNEPHVCPHVPKLLCKEEHVLCLQKLQQLPASGCVVLASVIAHLGLYVVSWPASDVGPFPPCVAATLQTTQMTMASIPGWQVPYAAPKAQAEQSRTSSCSSTMPPLYWAQAQESGTGYVRHVFEHRTHQVGRWSVPSGATSAVLQALTLSRWCSESGEYAGGSTLCAASE